MVSNKRAKKKIIDEERRQANLPSEKPKTKSIDLKRKDKQASEKARLDVARAEARKDAGLPAVSNKQPTFKSSVTGKASGVTLPTGETFLGISPKDVQKIQQQPLGFAAGAQGVGGAQAGAQGFTSPEEQALAEKLKSLNAFEEAPKENLNLKPKKTIEEDTPIVGAPGSAIVGVINEALRSGKLEFLKKGNFADKSVYKFLKDNELLGDQGVVNFPMADDATIRQKMLTEISRKTFNKGVTKNEAFGALVEAIPGVGVGVTNFAGELAETPGHNARKIAENIKGFGEDAANLREQVAKGLYDVDTALETAEKMDKTIAGLEGRLKLLIIQSAVLRSSTDELNKMEDDIFDAKTKVFNFRRQALIRKTAEISGTAQDPTEMQIFFKLRELSKK